MSKIKVIDGIMGIGKTRSMINHINNDTENNYIFITPFLDEVDRVKHSCKSKHFITPDESKMGTKKRHFEWLISKNTNIVSTHSLFKGVTDDEKELLSLKDYVLVLDEVMDVIEPIQVSKHDMETILEKYAHVDENGFLVWDDSSYSGDHDKIKRMALNSSLIYIDKTLLVWNFPVEVFKSFKEVYILLTCLRRKFRNITMIFSIPSTSILVLIKTLGYVKNLM